MFLELRCFVTPPCPHCGERSYPLLDPEAVRKWRTPRDQGGLLIQDAFPDMDPRDRETLITGYHPECWDAFFKGLEDEDDGPPDISMDDQREPY